MQILFFLWTSRMWLSARWGVENPCCSSSHRKSVSAPLCDLLVETDLILSLTTNTLVTQISWKVLFAVWLVGGSPIIIGLTCWYKSPLGSLSLVAGEAWTQRCFRHYFSPHLTRLRHESVALQGAFKLFGFLLLTLTATEVWSLCVCVSMFQNVSKCFPCLYSTILMFP